MTKLSSKQILLAAVVLVLIVLNFVSYFQSEETVKKSTNIRNTQNSLQYSEMAEIFTLDADDQSIKRDIFAHKTKKVVEQAKPVERKRITKKKAPSKHDVLRANISAELKKFQLAGIARKKDVLYAFIIFEDDTLEAKTGDILYKKYKVTEVTEKYIVLVHSASNTKEKVELAK